LPAPPATRVRTTVINLASIMTTEPETLSYAMQSAQMAGIHVQETSTMGLGAFATRPIPMGTWMGEYTGELITEYEVQTRYRGGRNNNVNNSNKGQEHCREEHEQDDHHPHTPNNDYILPSHVATAADDQWAYSRHARCQTCTGNYLFAMGTTGMLIDAEDTDCSNWCRYMNHAKEGTIECNVRPFHQTTLGQGPAMHKPRFFAVRDIGVGEELRYNYGNEFFSARVS